MSGSALTTTLLAMALVFGPTIQAPSDDGSDPSRLVDGLAHGDADAKVRCLGQIGQLGHRAIPLVPALIPVLADPEPRVRAVTAKLIRQLGPDASAASEAMLARLVDPDRSVRLAAADALRRLEAPAEKLIPAVAAAVRKDPKGLSAPAVHLLAGAGAAALPTALALLDEPDERLFVVGARVLQDLGPEARCAIGRLIEAARRPEREAREQTAWALARCGPDAVAPLIMALRDRDPRVRGVAARAVELMGFRAAAALATLVEGLGDPVPPDDPRPPIPLDFKGDPEYPQPTGYPAAIAAIGPTALRELVARLDRSEPRERPLLVRAIGEFGPAGRAAVPALVHLLVKPGCRAEAAEALHQIGAPARGAVPMLIPASKNRDPRLRLGAVKALGRMASGSDPPSPAHREALLAALRDSDPRVRAAAIEGLMRMSLSTPPEILSLIQDRDDSVRFAALRAIRSLATPDDASLVAGLKACQHDPSPRIRRAANDVMISANDAEVGLLMAALADPDAETRSAAAFRLALADPAGIVFTSPEETSLGSYPARSIAQFAGAGDALRKALEDPDRRVRAGACHALTALPDEAARTVPLLLERMDDPAAIVRIAAVSAIGKFGPAARDAVPVLLRRLDDVRDDSAAMFLLPQQATDSIKAIAPGELPKAYARLIELLDNPIPRVRKAACHALEVHIRATGPSLCSMLEDPKTPWSRRRSIGRFLLGCDNLLEDDGKTPIRELKPALVRAVLEERLLDVEEDDEGRTMALVRLVGLDQDQKAIVRTILGAHGKARLRLPSTDWLMSEVSVAAPSLAVGLQDADAEVRTVAAYMAGASGESLAGGGHQREILGRIKELLEDPDPQVRWAAAFASGLLKPDAPQAGPIIERLRGMLRLRTVRLPKGTWYLGGGSSPDSSDNTIHWSVQPSTPKLRVAACVGLCDLGALDGAEAAIPELVETLQDEAPLVRLHAAHALGCFEAKAAPAVPALMRTLAEPGDLVGLRSKPDDPEPELAVDGGQIRKQSARALGEIGAAARPAIPHLIRALDDVNPLVRSEAASSLRKLAEQDPSVMPILAVAARDRFDPGRSEAAMTALAEMRKPGIPFLLEELRSGDPDSRVLAARLLLSMTEEGPAVLPALRAAARDTDAELRQMAERGIAQIERNEKDASQAASDGDMPVVDEPH
ncbi:HEAT repeat domain-containing protein [Aquisphaera insulae]|uniref:HEAT repeat domain-containing protein n=1 Tax=Aquisphaera insulae TaxID=2712864 RepID=UPI0013EDBF33|nr:HEAT repeat domain-containing protein [Aquisphaera insulae]